MGVYAHFLLVQEKRNIMTKTEELQALIEPAVASVGYELLGIEFIAAGKHSVLRVYIDSPNGITVEDCATASHQISGILDVEDPISGEYRLEVSSPGVDRPLFRAEHYAQFVGEEVKMRLHAPWMGRRNFQGTIESVDGNTIRLVCDGEPVTIDIAQVERANLVPNW
jgi:ribosome maturation factor RimP